MSLHRITGVALDTLAVLADELAYIELAAVIEPPLFEKLIERKARRQRIVGRLGDARLAIVALREQLRRERELAPDLTTTKEG